jgi:hypothetical protein
MCVFDGNLMALGEITNREVKVENYGGKGRKRGIEKVNLIKV